MQIEYQENDNDHENIMEMVLELDFGGKKSPWVISNEQFYMQEDGWNCGPIGCLMIIEIYGWIALGSLPKIGKTQGRFHSAAMGFFSALLTTYDGDLRVQLRSNVGNNVPALGTIDESIMPSIAASSIAAHNQNITNAMAFSTINDKQVVHNDSDKGFSFQISWMCIKQTKTSMTTASIFDQIVLMLVSILGKG